MSYNQKYRPTTFKDVVGQKIITDILQREISNNKISPAYLFVGGSGQGKAQPLYSKLLTPNGYITMGEVKIGDEVFGEDGKPHKVIGIFPQGKKPVYELTFSDGSKCRCSDEHLWYISSDSKKSWKTVELKEFKDKSLKEKGSRYIYQIPITCSIKFSDTKLPLDPWLMGVLLGDGGFTDNTISVSLYEEDIFDRVKSILEADGFGISLFSKNRPKVKDYRISDTLFNKNTSSLSRKNGMFGNRMMQKIYDLGLLNHRSEDKFIPKCFLYNSIENRVKLLQGLFDTDGTLNVRYGRNNTKGCSISYSTSSKQLAEDIVFLVQSLGGTCSCNEHETFYTYKGEKKQGLNNFELYIKMPKNIKIFTSKKHKEKWIAPQLEPYRTIRNIEYIGKEDCQCILVDNPSHLYLTDNMIVTHNTTTSRIFANMIQGNIIEIDAASHNSADDMRNLVNSIQTPPIYMKHTVVILDEAGNFSKSAWDVLLKSLEEPPQHVIFILCTTEVDKIPKTIYNRSEVFQFQPISAQDIIDRLTYISVLEEINADMKALTTLARLADGSMRQAITYMEQCTIDNTLSIKTVSEVLGLNSYDTMMNLVYHILDKNVDSIVDSVNGISDANKFVEQFFSFVLDINIYLLTKKKSYLHIPKVYAGDIDKNIKDSEVATIKKLRKEMMELQFEGRNSPIIRELFLSTLLNFLGV